VERGGRFFARDYLVGIAPDQEAHGISRRFWKWLMTGKNRSHTPRLLKRVRDDCDRLRQFHPAPDAIMGETR
jgi:hypothetical protein